MNYITEERFVTAIRELYERMDLRETHLRSEIDGLEERIAHHATETRAILSELEHWLRGFARDIPPQIVDLYRITDDMQSGDIAGLREEVRQLHSQVGAMAQLWLSNKGERHAQAFVKIPHEDADDLSEFEGFLASRER